MPSKPKLTEREITKQIRDYLKWKGIFHHKVFQTLGSLPGVPDIIGVLEGGKALFIEIKTERGKLSLNQKKFLDEAKRLGCLAFVARSVEDLIDMGL